MSTQRAKFELFTRLQSLGFTYEESQALRRIEMTLRRWAEADCNGDIQRDEGTPYRVYQKPRGDDVRIPIADREAGALRRLSAIVQARNIRESPTEFMQANAPDWVFAYHQTDPRGAALYLITRAQLRSDAIDSVYNRGIAVCC